MPSSSNFFKQYRDAILGAVGDSSIQTALQRAVEAYQKQVNAVLEKYPHTRELAKEVENIKEQSLLQLNMLVEQAMSQIEHHKGKAYYAKDITETLRIADQIVGTGKIIVKGKSILGEELGIREHLIEKGNEVWETDLGEFIIQLLNERPMHIVAPSIHVPRERVAEILTEFLGKEVPPDPYQEVQAVKEFLKEKYFRADVGISGANVISADTGTLFIIENEGNVRLSTGAPPIHIAIVGIEKVVPTLQEAFKVAEVTWRYAGYEMPSYLNLICGPSATGDIEKVTVYGAHGPAELHVIFVDNGRSAMADSVVFREGLKCLRCGGCMYECPVFQLAAGHFGHLYIGGIGAPWTLFTTGELEKAVSLAYTCLRCGRCVERCPMKIDVPAMIIELRKMFANR